MVKRIKSSSLGVSTLYSQLSAKLELQFVGGVNPSMNKQWYYPNASGSSSKWKPDYTSTSLYIKPVLTVADPDTAKSYTPSTIDWTWVEVKRGASPKRFKGTVTEGGKVVYNVASDGTLEMKKNVMPDDPITLFCEAKYTDSRDNSQSTLTESVTVTASLAADETYSIRFGSSDTTDKTNYEHQYYNPLVEDTDSQRIIKAMAFLGDTDVTSDVTFKWYYVWKEGSTYNKSLVDDTEHPCLAYVSGQNTATLTVDADNEDENLEFEVHIAKNGTEIPNVFRRATVRWKIPDISGDVYSFNGDTARVTVKEHKFGVLYRCGKDDIADSVSEKRIMKEWKMKKDSDTSYTSLGTGHTMTVEESKLIDNSGKQMIVTADGYIKSPQKVMGIRYDAVASPSGNPKEKGWYELVNNRYTATNDTSVVSGKTYYTVNASANAVPNCVITQVINGVECVLVSRVVED